MIKRMTIRRHDMTKAKIMTAWKFLVDFEAALQHKLNWFTNKHNRAYKMDAMYVWKAEVEDARRHKGLVVRSHRYHRNRRLAQAMEDWSSAARLQHKLRLLEVCEQTEQDPLELAQAMEVIVDGIVLRQHVRSHELQVAHALRGRIADLKLQASVAMLEATLAKKVDKPTAEMIQRRGLRSWEAISTAQGTHKSQPKASPKSVTRDETPTKAAQADPAPSQDPEPEPSAEQSTLPQSSHRMLLEQQYRDQAARHVAAAAPIGPHEAYMRHAALGPHAVPPPHVADMHTEAAARASGFLLPQHMLPEQAERQRQLDEMNAAAIHEDAARHHEHMMHMQMQEQAMRDGGLLGGQPPSPGGETSEAQASEGALQRAREQVSTLQASLQRESRP
jgi:hypothetical protein